MSKERFALALAVTGVLIVAAVAVALALVSPDRLRTALVGGLTLPILWGAVELFTGGDKTEARHAVVVASALVLVALGVKLGQAAGWLGHDEGRLGTQLVGIFGGLVMAYFGNRIPKLLERFNPRVDAARRQAFQRHAGWVFVLAGLGSALTWALLPVESARLWGTLIVAGGVALVVARLIQCGLRGSKA
ncbi:MAG TPA: hypothetical protein VMG08_21630 [Allosphingosinicella sp.]|nr:hypothetical protein [Allosphingosinicella sp.]